MAQAWSSLGSSVTVVEAADRIVAREEPFVSEEVGDGLRAAGVELRTGVKAVGASRGEGGQVSLELEGGEELRGDELLVAVGRRPAHRRTSDSSGPASRPAATSRSTTSCGSTARDWLYAIGDVNGRALLTHMGKYQARIAADHILGRKGARGDCDLKRIAAGHLHRAAGRRRRPARSSRREGRGSRRSRRRRRDLGERRRQLHRPQRARHGADRGRRAAAGDRRRDLRRPRDRRVAARGDDRGRRRRFRSTACGTPCPRSRPAASSGSSCSRRTGSRPGPALDAQPALEVVEVGLGEAGDLVELVE